MTYEPKPIDCSHVELSPELLALTEELAANNHDVWARRRIEDGWKYGPLRDDGRKEHPNLVPYDQLPESEKEYDRQTALQVVRLLLASGWQLTAPEGVHSNEVEAAVASLRRLLQAHPAPSLTSLWSCWRTRSPAVWSRSPEPYRLMAEAFVHSADPLGAYDVAREGLERFPRDVRLRQLAGLALSRSGATESARQVLHGLYEEGHRDEETLGILARVYKDLGERYGSGVARDENLRLAERYYAEAYRSSGGYWSGINAATMAVLLGEWAVAESLAGSVREKCEARLPKTIAPAERYWLRATMAEAALISKEWEEAEELYRQAMEEQPGHSSVQSSRRNARLLLEHLDGDRDRIERCLPIPAVVVFSGHMVDRPGRAVPRFPPQLEGAVKRAIVERLQKIGVGFGYSSAACGSDILFIESMLDLDGDVCIVLPYDKDEFRQDSVDLIPGSSWPARYENALARAADVSTASFQRMIAGSTIYEYANLVLHGLAKFRAAQLDTRLVPLAVWDGKPGDGPGGTASAVERWSASGLDVEIIDLGSITRGELGEIRGGESARVTPAAPAANARDPEIRGLLFADAVGFSKLRENEVPLFADHFLGLVGELVKRPEYIPLSKNTWGDGLFIVFDNVRQVGLFALDLCERIRSIDWKAKGLRDLNLRVGLHAGPVHAVIDPVTGQNTYFGAHVSRAARIEPITPAGEVYASEEFAAIAAIEEVGDFSCDYVGRLPQAKGYGTFATYVVRRNLSSAA